MNFGTTPPPGHPDRAANAKAWSCECKAIIPTSRGARILPLTQGVGWTRRSASTSRDAKSGCLIIAGAASSHRSLWKRKGL